MGKDWQLLGEVPDSDDDDGLDSQESLPDLPVQQDLYGDLSEDEDTILADAPALDAPAQQPVLSVVLSPRKFKDIDIPAEIPSSPPRQKTPPPISQESSILSSLYGFDDDDEIDLVDDGLPVEDENQHSQPRSQALAESYDISNVMSKQEEGLGAQEDGQDEPHIQSQELPKQRPQSPPQLSQASHHSYTPPRPRTPQQSQPRHTPQQDADAPQPPPQTADPFSWSPTSSLSSLSRSPSPMLPEPAPQPAPASTHPSSGHRASSPPFEFPVIPDSPRAFRLGFVRSLRPRKPIQQHPYLLENAKYTHAMKRHGMKPVRTGYNPSTQRQPANNTEEDSQEQYEQPSEHDTQLPDVLSDPAFINDDVYEFPSSPPARYRDRDRPEVPSLSPSTSTPANRLLFLASSQGRADDATDDTSMAEEDDFPNPATYFQERRKRQLESLKAAKSSKSKRHGTPPTSSAAKRARLLDAALQPGAQASTTPPRAKWIPVPFSSSPDPLPRPSGRMRVIRSSSPPISSPPPQPYTIPDLSEPESDGDPEEAEEEDAGENEADAVRHNVRRIKGVLPASWLRLDKQKARPSSDRPPPTQRRPGPVDNAPRRGVALPRQGTGSAPFLASIFDDSDDNDATPAPISTTLSRTNDNDNDNNNTYARSRPKIAAADLWSEMDDDDGPPVYQVIDDEDLGSVMESDVIDRMESGPGRSRPTGNKKNTKTRQPKIDRMFDRAAASSIAHKTKSKPTGLARTLSKSSTSKSGTSKPRSVPRASGTGSGTTKRARRAPKTPPMLSILDFVESSPRIRQPDFIRVAARAARKSHTLGKASPSRKVINLGSRSDNVDALSVLQDWRASKIQPRIPNPARLKPRKPQSRTPSGAGLGSGSRSNSGRPQHPALHEISANLPIPRQPSSLKASTPAKRPAKKQYVNSISQKLAAPRQPASTAPTTNSMRPAQLETAVRSSRDTAAGFVAKKRALDEMYRQRRKEAAVRPNVHLEQFLDNQSNYGSVDMDTMDAMDIDDFGEERPVEQPPAPAPASAKKTKTPRKQADRSRFRKQYVPQAVDTSAPRFVHALDPLPVNTALVAVDLTADTADAAVVEPGSDKLRGLGPYGSQYSQHFDIFPLDSGVFFHKSTILGSGRLAAALGSFLAADMPAPTPVLSFQLDERTLCWTAWNDVSSSEFGILMDWLADSLFSTSQPAPLTTTTLFGPKVHTLFNFILDFIQSTISVADVEARKAFVLRTMEVVGSFVKRFESASILQPEVSESSFNMVNNSHLASLTGTVTIMSWLLRICRDTPECKMYAFQTEDMLSKVAKVCARALLKHGLDGVRASYNDLHRPSLRERGIRRDLQALCSWVVLAKVLEHAHVPRSGFWDVTYWAMYGNTKDKNTVKIHTTTDAGRLEQLWEDMFTLLPLTEFDSAGAVQAGIRQSMPVDGWELPKKVLERVFQVYKANPHQSPSFNAYCRALVGRCHYLAQEWGWRSCKAVIGTIFDFYGSQDFAHLRNEEVYSSPRFLEELSSSPSLKIESEDKCFHIFLKMLGVVILELKRLGLTKEMANLVARILPNHDRQYSKEADVHQRDLAALRNHHDLLCTLYWAVSPEVRPPLHQIEKLVAPAHSHKEACLINIRAWNQLARFVVVGNEGYGVYRGFVAWMRNIFNSMLEQYQSAESDMHRQFENLSKSMMQGIGPEMVKAMAAANQAAALDVLQACAAASFDVMQRAPTLGVATYCLSTDQLEGIFVKLDLSSSKCSNWTIFQTALDVLEHYMDRIDAVMDAQYASINSNAEAGAVDPAEADEAVMLLDHSVARGLFRLINTITHMSWDDLPRSVAAVRVQCTEKSLVLAARLASRFVHAGMYNLGKFFGNTNSNEYSLFERLPHAPGLVQRRYLPLFVCGLVGSNVFDLKDLGGTNMLEQWLLAVVKPARFLGYENRLARVLQQHNLPYVRRANIVDGPPSYDTNRTYFACAMASMRQQLREEDSLTQSSRKHLRTDFARALRLVMNQIKEDLRFLSRSAATAAAAGHGAYVLFVREIVALMRSHGGDICTLDEFYLKQSIEYAPSPEDPQLRAASIVTYGLRLGEGEATAAPQLFYYLHNSFNIALANGELAAECRLLERSMAANGGILKFVLERMLPAILRVSISTNHKVATAYWPLLDVYCSAVEQFLTESVVPQAIDDEVMAGGIASLFGDIVQLLVYAFGGFSTEEEEMDTDTATLKVRIRTMAQLAALANVLRPLIMASVCLEACTDATRQQIQASIASLYELVTVYGDASTSAGELLSAVTRGSFTTTSLDRPAPQVAQFAASISKHVADNWVVEADGSISVKRSSTTTTSTATFSWSMDELVDELRRQLGLWTLVPVHMRFSSNGRRRPYEGRVRR